MRRTTAHRSSQGFALLAALLLLLLLSAMAVALVYMTSTESRLGGTDRENTLAYYGAEAAMEKMMTDLSSLYNQMQAPTTSEINALEASKPSLPGVTFAEYDLGAPGTTVAKTISSGPNAGLIALITPITLNVTARRPGGVEVKMSRDVEVAQIPVFQFAKFSEIDLSYEASPPLTTTGRVHTNGNLFVSSSGSTLTFQTKVTAVKDVIRDKRQSGSDVDPNGKVYVTTAASGCPNFTTNCRELKMGEGSRIGWLTGPKNANWPGISTGSPPSGYNGYLLNGDTGARRLDLSFVQPGSGMGAIEILRRPPTGESPALLVSQSRLHNQAQIRVLLSDNPADLPGGAGDPENIRLANVGPYANGVPVSNIQGISGGGSNTSNTYFAEATAIGSNKDNDWLRPGAGINDWPLLDGYLRVEVRKADGTYMGVTREWLQLGFARGLESPSAEAGVTNNVHPNAILLFQMLRDTNDDGDTADTGGSDNEPGNPPSHRTKGSGAVNYWYPINLYDPREGDPSDTSGPTDCALGGILNVVELDAGNLRKWLFGTIGATGTQVEDATQNGFIFYFSDRRGMLPNPNAGNVITGEYGWEDVDVVNGVLEPNEDSNGNGVLDTWGKANLGDGFKKQAQGGNNADDHPYNNRVACAKNSGADRGAARKNRVSGARHVLKVVNGSLGNVPTKRDNTGGFTVASENAIYVVGNYNANAAGFGDPHAAAAVIADRITLLSKVWKDVNSFRSPTNPFGRRAATTYWRTAILGGTETDKDTAYRNLEDWSGLSWYRLGSDVNLYFANQGVGRARCCNTQYKPPTRNSAFDTDFLIPSKLPPGTPMLRDVVNIGFRQVLRAD